MQNGKKTIGWQLVNSKWYYMNNNGEMATGWIKDTNGKWNFMDNNGEMLCNTTIDGYNLGFDGAWI